MHQFGHPNLIQSLVGTLPIILLHCFYGNLSALLWSCRNFFYSNLGALLWSCCIVFSLYITATRVPFSCDNVVTFSPPILSAAASQNDVPLLAHAAEPIWVAHKPKRHKHVHNVFYDDRDFPDQSDKLDYLLHSVDGGPVLRKLWHPAPDLDGPVDPSFLLVFNPSVHESQLRDKLNLSHLSLDVQDQIYDLIWEFWSVFDSKGVTVPVKLYECVIDTESAWPIAIKKINYGNNKTEIMIKCIAALAKVGHICQIHNDKWLFKALLAPKPHLCLEILH